MAKILKFNKPEKPSNSPIFLFGLGTAIVGGFIAGSLLFDHREQIVSTGQKAYSHTAKFTTACNIKGNISINTGERIYHLPGQKYYSSTRILPRYGERYFCSEAQARAAGWRISRR